MMAESFIQERRRALERYLNRLSVHPEIKDSGELKHFLEMQGRLGKSLKWRAMQPNDFGLLQALGRLSRQIFGREDFIKVNEVSNTSNRNGNLLRMMTEGVQSVKNEIQRKKTITRDEKALRRKQQFLNMIEDLLPDLAKAAEMFVKRCEKMSDVLAATGVTLLGFAKFEEEQGLQLTKSYNTTQSLQKVSHATKQSGFGFVRVAHFAKKASRRMEEELLQIQEYQSLLPSVRRALICREQAFLTLQVVENQHERRQRLLQDLTTVNAKKLGGYASTTRLIEIISEQVNLMSSTVEAAKAEYTRIKTTNFSEIERFEKQRESDFLTMLHDLSNIQSNYAENCAKVWLNIALELGATIQDINSAKRGFLE